MRNKIQILHYNLVEPFYENEHHANVYKVQIQQNGFQGWIQKHLLKYFKKHAVLKHFVDSHKFVDMKVVTIDLVSLHETLMNYYDNIMTTYGIAIDRILVGQDVYQKLTSQTLEQPVHFIIQPDSMYGYPKFFCGIPIQVIPWIDGIVFVPKE